ncbi:MAG: hypothetical protein AB1765_07950 [Candidatus Hydrogenedentota bacterium]
MIYGVIGLFVVLNSIVVLIFYILIIKKIIKYEDSFKRERENINLLISEFNRVAELYISDLEQAKEELKAIINSSRETEKKTRVLLDRDKLKTVIRNLKEKGVSDEEVATKLQMSLQEIEILQSAD